jgi:mRNA interferase ChpB
MSIRRGDIYSVELDPIVGHEQRGRRPVLVVSPEAYNKVFLPLVCPITSGGGFVRDRGFAVVVTGGKTTGVVLCNQARTLDLKARKGRRIEAATPEVLQQALWALQDIVAD